MKKSKTGTRIIAVAAVLALCLGAVLLSTGASTGEVPINETNFPDKEFREYVAENFDTNDNGSLSELEIERVTTINIQFKPDLKNLIGIGYFTELTTLTCAETGLEELDVSMLTKLKKLNCNGSQLITLDLSQNTALTDLDVRYNHLVALDLTQNINLSRRVYLDGNFRHITDTTIDMSKLCDTTLISDITGGTMDEGVITPDTDAKEITYKYGTGYADGDFVVTICLEHAYGNDDTQHWYTCICQGKSAVKENHSIERSINSDGDYVYDCTVCGYHKVEEVTVKVGEVTLDNGEYATVKDDGSMEKPVTVPTDNYAYLKDGVLTLKNLTYTNDGVLVGSNYFAIRAEVDLIVRIEGINVLKNGISGDKVNLTVEGTENSSLAINDSNKSGVVSDGTLTVKNLTLTVIKSGHAGIESSGLVSVLNSKLTVNDASNSNGIWSNTGIVIDKSEIIIDKCKVGIRSNSTENSISITDSKVTIKTATTGDGRGIYAFKAALIISGSEINIGSTDNDAISAETTVKISSSNITVTKATNSGICGKQGVIIENNSIINIEECGHNGIYAQDDIVINSSKIFVTKTSRNIIYSRDKNITVSGSVITADTVEQNGIHAEKGAVTLQSTEITLTDVYEHGIRSMEKMTITGGTMSFEQRKGGDSDTISTDGNLEISGSNIKVIFTDRSAVYAKKDIIISNGATFELIECDDSAFYAEENISVSGSKIKIDSVGDHAFRAVDTDDYGDITFVNSQMDIGVVGLNTVWAPGQFTVEGTTLTVKSTNYPLIGNSGVSVKSSSITVNEVTGPYNALQSRAYMYIIDSTVKIGKTGRDGIEAREGYMLIRNSDISIDEVEEKGIYAVRLTVSNSKIRIGSTKHNYGIYTAEDMLIETSEITVEQSADIPIYAMGNAILSQTKLSTPNCSGEYTVYTEGSLDISTAIVGNVSAASMRLANGGSVNGKIHTSRLNIYGTDITAKYGTAFESDGNIINIPADVNARVGGKVLTGEAVIDEYGNMTVSEGGVLGGFTVPVGTSITLPVNKAAELKFDSETGELVLDENMSITKDGQTVYGPATLSVDGDIAKSYIEQQIDSVGEEDEPKGVNNVVVYIILAVAIIACNGGWAMYVLTKYKKKAVPETEAEEAAEEVSKAEDNEE